MPFEVREMRPDDYPPVIALWQASEGIGLSEADSPEGIDRYLARNPGLSFVALEQGQLVGALLCGQDGRRGYLHHLAVSQAHRRQGIGKALVDRCLEALAALEIDKCHIFVYRDNGEALAFWENTGWETRTELQIMSYRIQRR